MSYEREYLNRDTQELLTEAAAKKQWRDEYDGDDPTNLLRFEEQYALIRFWYGMSERGFSIGCQPKGGLIERLDDETGEFYDILVYDRRLTDEEISRYELRFIKHEYKI